MNKYSRWIKQYFYKRQKTMLGQQLNIRLQEEFNVTPVYARKIIVLCIKMT